MEDLVENVLPAVLLFFFKGSQVFFTSKLHYIEGTALWFVGVKPQPCLCRADRT